MHVTAEKFTPRAISPHTRQIGGDEDFDFIVIVD
jgi:hypothetical protein